jgi:hypothetical protein
MFHLFHDQLTSICLNSDTKTLYKTSLPTIIAYGIVEILL